MKKESNFSSDISLIIECCKTEQDENTIKELITLILDWDEFMELSYSHGVFPLVYHTLKTHTDLIPEEVLSIMKFDNMDIVKKNMLMTTELIKVMKLLEENNIEAIAFKGPTLSQMAYGDVALRQYVDLDILVQKKDLYSAANTLSNSNMTTNIPIKILKNQTLLDIGSDLSFFNSNNTVHVELHWNLFRKLLSKESKSFNVWKAKETIHINNYPINILSNDYLTLYLCIHGSKHLWERVEWIVDLDKLLRQKHHVDWDFIIHNSKKLNSYTMLLIGLNLSYKLFYTPVPDKIKTLFQTDYINKLSKKMIEFQTNNTMLDSECLRRIFLKFKFISFMQDSKFNAIKYYISSLFKPTHYDIYFIDLSKRFSLLYYLVRPIRLVSKIFKKT